MTLLSCETLLSETLFPEVEIIIETRVFGLEIPGLWLGKPPKEVRKREEERKGEGKEGRIRLQKI